MALMERGSYFLGTNDFLFPLSLNYSTERSLTQFSLLLSRTQESVVSETRKIASSLSTHSLMFDRENRQDVLTQGFLQLSLSTPYAPLVII